MPKNIAFAGVGLFLLASPLLVAAQTTTASNTSLIATLTALVQTLEAELQALIAGHSSTTPTQQTTVATGSANCVIGVNCQKSAALSGAGPNITPCAAYANLAKGDTDATTGGEVTQLQQFVGISPTTGYYGAQTSIAYQNKCGNLGNAQPTSVPGMSEYTDSSFGFSFWYPSGWTVAKSNDTLTVSGGNLGYPIQISEVHSIDGVNINGHLSSTAFDFDSTKGEWMMITQVSDGSSAPYTQPADVSQNSMGGLHLLFTNETFTPIVVPLSASNFLLIGYEGGDSATASETRPLAQTIVATNPAVAIPVSTAQQTATIKAEASAYGTSSSNSNSNEPGFSASPISGSAPLAVAFNMPGAFDINGTYVAFSTLDYGDGTMFRSGIPPTESNNVSCDAAGLDSVCQGGHVYTSPGTYTAKLEDSSGNIFGTATIIVN